MEKERHIAKDRFRDPSNNRIGFFDENGDQYHFDEDGNRVYTRKRTSVGDFDNLPKELK